MSVCKYRAFMFLDQPPPWVSRTLRHLCILHCLESPLPPPPPTSSQPHCLHETPLPLIVVAPAAPRSLVLSKWGLGAVDYIYCRMKILLFPIGRLEVMTLGLMAMYFCTAIRIRVEAFIVSLCIGRNIQANINFTNILNGFYVRKLELLMWSKTIKVWVKLSILIYTFAYCRWCYNHRWAAFEVVIRWIVIVWIIGHPYLPASTGKTIHSQSLNIEIRFHTYFENSGSRWPPVIRDGHRYWWK